MKVFQIKTKPHNIQRFDEFLEEGFICIGWPGIGDLSNINKDGLRNKISEVYSVEGHSLGNVLGHVNAFANTMQEEDIVLIRDKEWAYIGKVGGYIYIKEYDNSTDGMCHRREVNWFDKSLIKDLDVKLQNLLSNRNTISSLPELIDDNYITKAINKQFDLSLENDSKFNNLFSKSLIILERELESDDEERRLRAATELIRMKNS